MLSVLVKLNRRDGKNTPKVTIIEENQLFPSLFYLPQTSANNHQS